jgi:hypothetical protein
LDEAVCKNRREGRRVDGGAGCNGQATLRVPLICALSTGDCRHTIPPVRPDSGLKMGTMGASLRLSEASLGLSREVAWYEKIIIVRPFAGDQAIQQSDHRANRVDELDGLGQNFDTIGQPAKGELPNSLKLALNM